MDVIVLIVCVISIFSGSGRTQYIERRGQHLGGGFCVTQCTELFNGLCTWFLECRNGGSCVTVEGQNRCSCPENFSGTMCQTFTPTVCDYVRCRHGGRCVARQPANYESAYKCVCPRGYTGTTCEHVSPCVGCVHGVCVKYRGRRTCRCLPGWTGSRCNRLRKYNYNNVKYNYNNVKHDYNNVKHVYYNYV